LTDSMNLFKFKMEKTTIFLICLLIMEGRSLTEGELEAKFTALKEEFFQDLEIKLGKSPRIKSIENQLRDFRNKIGEMTPAIQDNIGKIEELSEDTIEDHIGTGKVKELKLSIYGSFFLTCGGTSVYLELLEGQTSCTTSTKEDFDGGVSLSWSGDQLGSCAGKLFDVQLDVLNFKLRSTYTDEFCPTTLVIKLYDIGGKIYRYKADGINDWVAKDVNDHIRTASKL